MMLYVCVLIFYNVFFVGYVLWYLKEWIILFKSVFIFRLYECSEKELGKDCNCKIVF